jgi:hypothetical protein
MMPRLLRRFALLALLATVTGCVSPRQPYLLSDVVTRSQRGDSAQAIVSALRIARTTYALKGSDFAELRAVGVHDTVLDHLQQGFTGDVEFLVRPWSASRALGRCAPCFPQQVDLSSLQSNGSVRQTPPPLRATAGRALGLPDWYRNTHGYLRDGGITVDELRDLHRSGMSEDQLLAELRTRRLSDVIGVGGNTRMSTRLEPGVSGSTLADLAAEGIPPAVLDELQVNYLAVLVEFMQRR